MFGPNIRMSAIVAGVALATGLATGGWLGYRVAEGGRADELRDLALRYAEGWKSAVEAANLDAAAERKRAVSAAEARGRASAATREVIHAATADPDTRNCGWRDEHRLRLAAIYAAHGAADRPRPALGMHGTLPGASGSDGPTRDVGTADSRLGTGLQAPAR